MTYQLEINQIIIKISDKAKMKAFYSDILKLTLLEESDTRLVYGFEEQGPSRFILDVEQAQSIQNQTGLYHYAILMPERKNLGSIIAALAKIKYQEIDGGSDHLVSEALYIRDPEDNTIELYVDKPADTWQWSNGQVLMDTLPMDVDGLLELAEEWNGFPKGTKIGHLHFYGNDMIKADMFYMEVLGTDLVSSLGNRVHFYSINQYHHNFAVNTWKGTTIPMRDDNTLGLSAWSLLVNEAYFKQIEENIEKLGHMVEPGEDTLTITDVVGTKLTIIKHDFA